MRSASRRASGSPGGDAEQHGVPRARGLLEDLVGHAVDHAGEAGTVDDDLALCYGALCYGALGTGARCNRALCDGALCGSALCDGALPGRALRGRAVHRGAVADPAIVGGLRNGVHVTMINLWPCHSGTSFPASRDGP
jgi:hypothetical protein